MKNRAVKLLSLLMCMVMIFTSLPVGALADGEDTQPTEEALETAPPDEEGVPKESAENSVEPVSVEFICAPGSLTLSVYAKEDEAHENPILPEEDGSYLLLPGFYTYTAECEGYESAEDVEFEVTADEKQEIEVALKVTMLGSTRRESKKDDDFSLPNDADYTSESIADAEIPIDGSIEANSLNTYAVAAASQSTWLWPVADSKTISSNFGLRDLDGNGSLEDTHSGIDISCPLGTAIRAAKSGTISSYCNQYGNEEKIWSSDMSSYGNYVAIQHDDGTYSLYAHMSNYSMITSGHVNQGDIIGYSGNSGASGGPHTHFQARSSWNGWWSEASGLINVMPTESCINNNGIYVVNSAYQIPSGYSTTRTEYIFSTATYTVTFDANGGSCSTGSVQVSAGGTLSSLPTPTRSGYDFVGWYWSKTYGNEFHTYYAIDSDTTLYAHWARQSNPGIKINFNSNGGQLGTASGTLTANRINAERGENEVIVYDWSGETVNSNKFGTEIAVNSVGKVIGYREGYSETCLAVPNGGYVMSFQLDNSNACTFMENNRQKYIGFQYATKTIYAFDTYDAYLANLKYVTKGQAYGDLPTPTRDGYVFDGWYTSASGGTKITATSTVSVSSAQTLYAHWTVPCEHNYTTQAVAGTCTQIPGTIYTCTKCGDSYFAASTFYMSSWSATKPSGVDESLIESRIEYRSREKEYTSSANSSMSGWTADGSSTAYGDYGAWSDWVRDPITESDTTQVDRQPLYKYYYFRCTSCGDHNPFSGSCGCGGQSNDWYETWLTTPYTASNSSVVSYASSKRQTTSLGDGQLWYFSSGNLNDTAIGTMDTTSTSEVIQQGYRSRTRTVTTTYYYYRWKNWSLWGAEPISATEDKQVETRTTYRYYLGWDSAHTWDSGKVTKAAKCEATGVKTYTCAECGKTRTETIAATGHNWGAWTVTKAPTASTAGTETRTCKTSGCGKTETRSVTAETVTITFNANGGSCSTSSSKIIKGGSLSSLPTATRSGYTFDGWYTSGGTKVTTSSKFSADNTLTARWTAVATKVKVTFNANGGSCLTGSTEISKGGKLSSLPTATRSGYTFDGWYTAASGGTKISTSTTFSANTTVYAHWTVAVSNEPKIVVSNGSARPGAEVDVTVSLENNPGIVGMTLRRFDYDSTKLQLLSITESGMSGTWQKATGVTWASDTGDNTYNGVFLTLKFKVLDTAETGATPVSVYYEEGDICNNALDDVNFTPVAGQVNISLRVPGDTNGDGRVNTKDFIAVMKYLAGEGSGDTASCDVNGDGKVNTKDYITLMKYLAGDKITLY
mgnify:CR=1 FL=1